MCTLSPYQTFLMSVGIVAIALVVGVVIFAIADPDLGLVEDEKKGGKQ